MFCRRQGGVTSQLLLLRSRRRGRSSCQRIFRVECVIFSSAFEVEPHAPGIGVTRVSIFVLHRTSQSIQFLVLKDTENFANIKFLLLDPQGELFQIERIGKNERIRTRTQTRTSATDLAQYRRAQFQSDCQRSSTY